MILELAGEIVGYVNSGCAYEVTMADEAIKDLRGATTRPPRTSSSCQWPSTRSARGVAMPGRYTHFH